MYISFTIFDISTLTVHTRINNLSLGTFDNKYKNPPLHLFYAVVCYAIK